MGTHNTKKTTKNPNESIWIIEHVKYKDWLQ